jgi:hypothetical protein
MPSLTLAFREDALTDRKLIEKFLECLYENTR